MLDSLYNIHSLSICSSLTAKCIVSLLDYTCHAVINSVLAVSQFEGG